MGEKLSFNINAELYENQFGELAIMFPGNKVYGNVGTGKNAGFVQDCINKLEKDQQPGDWQEMPAHQLLYGKDWHCVCRMGYLEGDVAKPGVEFEVQAEALGDNARAYLREALARTS